MSYHQPEDPAKPDSPERIAALQSQIADLKKRLPRHSTPPRMLQQLEDLEEALEQELAKHASDSP